MSSNSLVTQEARSSFLYALARVSIAALFIVSGAYKATNFSAVAGWMAHTGVPLASFALTGTLLLEIVGGTALLLGWKTRWLSLLFAVFVVVATLTFHRFWAVEATMFDAEFNHFLKNIAILGGLVALHYVEVGKALVSPHSGDQHGAVQRAKPAVSAEIL